MDETRLSEQQLKLLLQIISISTNPEFFLQITKEIEKIESKSPK